MSLTMIVEVFLTETHEGRVDVVTDSVLWTGRLVVSTLVSVCNTYTHTHTHTHTHTIRQTDRRG